MVTERIINWFENRKKESARMEEQWKVIRPPAKYGITATISYLIFAVFIIYQKSIEVGHGYLNATLMITLPGYFLLSYLFGGFSRKIICKTRFQIFAVLLLLLIGVELMRNEILHSKFWLAVGCIISFVGSYLFRKIKLEFIEGGEK